MDFYIFLICLFCGVVSGTVYDVLYAARIFVCGTDKGEYTVKDRFFIIICDILYCLIFCAAFIFISVTFGFYSFRAYTFAGCALGFLIYLKSIHQIVAFFLRKVYNNVNRLKVKMYERRKKKPHSRRADRKHGAAHRNSGGGNNLPARHDFGDIKSP